MYTCTQVVQTDTQERTDSAAAEDAALTVDVAAAAATVAA